MKIEEIEAPAQADGDILLYNEQAGYTDELSEKVCSLEKSLCEAENRAEELRIRIVRLEVHLGIPI